MVEYTQVTDKDFLNEVIKGYVATIGKITTAERKELRKWVADGNRVCDNPWLIYDENGFMMDFISACRINEDMTINPDAYWGDSENYSDELEELPF
jgi:hypothetical protein